MSHDFVHGQSVAETCFSYWGYLRHVYSQFNHMATGKQSSLSDSGYSVLYIGTYFSTVEGPDSHIGEWTDLIRSNSIGVFSSSLLLVSPEFYRGAHPGIEWRRHSRE